MGRRTPDAVLLRGEGRHRSPRDGKMVCVRLLQWRRINIGNICVIAQGENGIFFGTDGKAVKPQTVTVHTVDNGAVIGDFSTVSKEGNNFIMVL